MHTDPRPKMLIVDDRRENLFALERLLQPLNVIVLQADSGNEALALALENDFFVAILDVQMADMDGYELAELLRGNYSTASLPIIFVSAVFSDEYHHRKGYEAGAVDFISKPFVPEILLSKIRVFLDLYQQRNALQHSVQQLELVNQELETLSYSISHDLRAPLRAIDGFLHILDDSMGIQVSADQRRYLDTIHENAHQMNELIDGLLEFSRLAFEPLSSREINMPELAEHALVNIRAALPESRAQVKLADLPPAWGDPALIRRVFANLLENAFKYSRKRETPEIEIGFKAQDGQITYFVRDNGVGFDMQYADKLFGVFQRLHAADDFEGIGVGLANVRRIILRHGGQLWAESKPDQGATFYFTLHPAPVEHAHA